MSEEGSESTEDKWVIEAPGAGQIKVALGLGEGAELTSEQQEALGALMAALHDADVTGFADFGRISFDVIGKISLDYNCTKLACTGTHTCDNLDHCDSYSITNKLRR